MEAQIKVNSLNLPTFNERLYQLNKKAIKLGVEPAVFNELSRSSLGHGQELITGKLEYTFIQLPNYTMLGVIDFNPSFNAPLLRSVPGRELPKECRGITTPHCDYCGLTRTRKETFILEHKTTGKILQVGRNCLAEFLGIDASIPLGALQFLKSYDELSEGLDDISAGIRWDLAVYPVADILAIASATIKARGWVPAGDYERGPTVELVKRYLASTEGERQKLDISISETDKATAQAVIEFIQNADSNSDYMYNLKTIVSTGRTNWGSLAILVSSIASYQKSLIPKNSGEFIGKAGDKYSGQVTVSNIRTINGNYGTTFLITFTTKEGNLLVWFASKAQDLSLNDVVTLTGTIKKHEEYRGLKQTYLTRCKVLKGENHE